MMDMEVAMFFDFEREELNGGLVPLER
jgi:hypothetical protein